MSKRIVIALGGNALGNTAAEQLQLVTETAKSIVDLIAAGNEVVVAHGNGPQVGRILLQNEAGKSVTPPMPMDVCGAMTQGMIGYHIQQGLSQVLRENGIDKPVCTLVTQVEVDSADPAFQNPTKPVGAFYTEEEAMQIQAEKGYAMKKDANRGYRRVVPSPKPQKIIEIDTIKTLVDGDTVVVAAGGGGIPVLPQNEELKGASAVIEKDLTSGLMAEMLNADMLMILTSVENVSINYGTPDEKPLEHITVADAKKYIAEGQFGENSMLPKMEAAVSFLEKGIGRTAVITSIDSALAGFQGKTGTIIE